MKDMATLTGTAATNTNLSGVISDYSIANMQLDAENSEGESYYDFPNAPQQLAYYKTIPELKRAVDALSIWVAGKGVTTDTDTKVILDHISGNGSESFQAVITNLFVQKKIFGDAFAEIIREDDTIINIKPLYTGDMRVVYNKKGIIIRYEQKNHMSSGIAQKFKPEDILHLSNDRIGNEMHGVSVIDACKWVIDARNEAMLDMRKLEHRQLAMGVLYVDSDKASTIQTIMTQYENAIKNGEVLVLPKDTAQIQEAPKGSPADKLAWIQYLENVFYQVVGIPRVIANSQDYSEAASKVGYMTFEPVYTREQTLIEADMWGQLGIIIKFNRPPSLSGVVAESEAKNTGQVGIQQSEVQASMGRVE